jgi:NAD(P)H-flavin reductase
VPNLGLIKESLYRKDSLRHTLLYSNKTRGDIIYFYDFEALRTEHPDKLDVIHCITREDPSGIRGARGGRTCRELLQEVAPDPSAVLDYSCGPGITPCERKAAKAKGEEPAPRFVENMFALLQEHGLHKTQIKQESWG